MPRYTGTFENPHLAIADVVSHAESFGIDVVSLTVEQGSIVAIETAGEMPADQLDHLGLTVA